MSMMYGVGWGGGLGSWIMMLGGIAFLVGLMVLFLWSIGARPGGRDSNNDGIDRAGAILRERYARGEISQSEYEQARKALGL